MREMKIAVLRKTLLVPDERAKERTQLMQCSMKDGPYNRIDSELGIMAKKGEIANLPR